LIIWDLDETLWQGVLSDHTARISADNIQLIKDITDAGVICSICSKNDEDKVHKYLNQLGIDDLFVFSSINWTPKGKRVKQIIDDMALRQVNTLFIDDNASNLAEVKRECEQINVADVDILTSMKEYYSRCKKKDKSHTRLQQYKVLEKKLSFKANAGSNEEFLRSSNIRVNIFHDCENHVDRIADLIMRSNQLNFTKRRDSKDEIISILKDEKIEKGYVKVEDNYGDYGIIGFFAINNHECIHFVFSCRTLNMGVEQYVYSIIGKPKLEIVGEVASSLSGGMPDWINQATIKEQNNKFVMGKGKKILLKGPCDMQQLFSYIDDSPDIITEFSFVNDKGISIENGNHSSMVLQCLTIQDDVRDRILHFLPFTDERIFRTTMFDNDIGIVLFSLFMESHLGLYRERQSNAVVAFGEYTNDLTDEKNWNGFLNRTLFDANCRFTRDNLIDIRAKYEFIGRLSPEESFENIQMIHKRLKDKILILNCGSEIPYLGVSHEVNKDKHLYNKKLNSLLREWTKTVDNVFLIDVNDYINGQDDFVNSITHFKKRIYYEMSSKLIEIINNNCQAVHITQGSQLKVGLKTLLMKVKKKASSILR